MNIRWRDFGGSNFLDIIHLVDDETTLANDSLFSKEVLRGYGDKKEAPK